MTDKDTKKITDKTDKITDEKLKNKEEFQDYTEKTVHEDMEKINKEIAKKVIRKQESYNYFLMDESKIDMKSFLMMKYERKENDTEWIAWKSFLDSIFYIGKGTEIDRPYYHIREAYNKKEEEAEEAEEAEGEAEEAEGENKGNKESETKKISKCKEILNILNDQANNLMILRVFNKSYDNEALVREFLMINMFNKLKLGNILNGSIQGLFEVKNMEWFEENKLELGRYLLYKSFQKFCDLIIDKNSSDLKTDFSLEKIPNRNSTQSANNGNDGSSEQKVSESQTNVITSNSTVRRTPRLPTRHTRSGKPR